MGLNLQHTCSENSIPLQVPAVGSRGEFVGSDLLGRNLLPRAQVGMSACYWKGVTLSGHTTMSQVSVTGGSEGSEWLSSPGQNETAGSVFTSVTAHPDVEAGLFSSENLPWPVSMPGVAPRHANGRMETDHRPTSDKSSFSPAVPQHLLTCPAPSASSTSFKEEASEGPHCWEQLIRWQIAPVGVFGFP